MAKSFENCLIIPSDTVPHQTTLNSAESSPHVEVVDFDQTASINKKIDPLVFQQAVRKLWEDHVTWTRVYIIAALADLPEADRIPLEAMRTDSPEFQKNIESRRNRRDEWYKVPAGRIDVCNVPLPVRKKGT